jgi:hypothetical protein
VRFAPECGRAIASVATPTDAPVGGEDLFEFATSGDAAAAQQAQGLLERSSEWPCGVASQCPPAPLDVPSIGVPVVAVSFALGARGNLSEVHGIATALKGRYVLNFSWISASTVSSARVTAPAGVRAYLITALGRVPG